jgi:carbon monoxide dehydrogenase subunit G
MVAAPFSEVWQFVRDMDNWAPLVTGYQSHDKIDDTESIWFLKGELGGLTRVAEFKAIITEWDESGRVTFELEGVNEPVTGSGSFLASAQDMPPEEAAGVAEPTSRKRGFFGRLKDGFFRFVFDRIFGGKGSSEARSDTSPAPATAGQTRITFDLTLTAGGMAGVPMNMMIAPMLKPVAEDLAKRIADTIESGGKTRGGEMRLLARENGLACL